MLASSAARRIGICLLIVLPVALALIMMCRHWVAVPWWDEWLTPGQILASYYQGTLSWSDFWSQHNESRKVIPRLLYLALFGPFGWDVRYGMALTFAGVCFGSAGLYCLLRQTTSRRSVWVGFFFMILLLFSPRQYENFLYAIEWENFAPAFALILALVCNLRLRSFGAKTLLCALLALLSTYTFANGMLVWLLAFPVHGRTGESVESAKTRWVLRVAYALAALAAVSAYFLGYQHPLASPPFGQVTEEGGKVFHFWFDWLGNVFLTPFPALIGTIGITLFASLFAWHAQSAWKTGDWRRVYPWVVLGSYTLISGLVTACGRVSFGLIMALDVRYVVFTVFLYISIAGLLSSADGMKLRRPIAILCGLVLTVAWTFTLWREMPRLDALTADRQHLESVVRWSGVIPANPDLQLLSPYKETPARLRVLQEHRAMRPGLIEKRLELAAAAGAPAGPVSVGFLDRVSFEEPNELRVSGWARIPGRGIPADGVVIGFQEDSGRWNLFGVTETGKARPDVAAALGQPGLGLAGFDRTFSVNSFPQRRVNFMAWAIDRRHGRLLPITGSIPLAPSD